MKRRVFEALPVLGDEAARWMERARAALGPDTNARLARADGLHLTLFFLGDVEEERLPAIWDAVREATRGCAAPRCTVDHTGAFPRFERPRVLWLGLREEPGMEGRLEHLWRAVLGAVERAGFALERECERGFQPHVTVARLRAGARPRIGAFASLALAGRFRARDLALMESLRGPGAARYSVLETRALEDPDSG